MARIHRLHPPVRRSWDLPHPVTWGMVTWVVIISATLEQVSASPRDGSTLLSQLLTTAGNAAPRLADIRVDFLGVGAQEAGVVHAVVCSLQFCNRLRQLCLRAWRVVGSGALAEIYSLSALLRLEVLPRPVEKCPQLPEPSSSSSTSLPQICKTASTTAHRETFGLRHCTVSRVSIMLASDHGGWNLVWDAHDWKFDARTIHSKSENFIPPPLSPSHISK